MHVPERPRHSLTRPPAPRPGPPDRILPPVPLERHVALVIESANLAQRQKNERDASPVIVEVPGASRSPITLTQRPDAPAEPEPVSTTAAEPPPSPNRGVVSEDPSGKYGWDWTQTTHEAKGSGLVSREVASDLVGALGGAIHVPGGGLRSWEKSVVAYDADGFKIGTVYWGGRTDVHVVSTSSAAERARSRVVALHDARTSRVDTRVDTLAPYDELADLCVEAAGLKARVVRYESEQGGVSTGRTLYVGSPKSNVRVRLYEKWLESPGQYVEGTNRVEVQLRPPSRAKGLVSGWSRAETFCATELSRRVAAALGSEVARPGTLEKERGTPDLERTLASMGRQYGPGVRRWLDITGGELGTVLDRLLGDSVDREYGAL